jgi:hypothetical protein
LIGHTEIGHNAREVGLLFVRTWTVQLNKVTLVIGHNSFQGMWISIASSNSTPQRTTRLFVIRKVLIGEIKEAMNFGGGGGGGGGVGGGGGGVL